MATPHVFVAAHDCTGDSVALRGEVAHRLPRVAPVTTCADAFAGATHGVVLWEEATVPLHAVAFADAVDQVTVGIGPEGGLTAQEVHVTGLPVACLGAAVLRAETAGAVGPALVLHRLGRLG